MQTLSSFLVADHDKVIRILLMWGKKKYCAAPFRKPFYKAVDGCLLSFIILSLSFHLENWRDDQTLALLFVHEGRDFVTECQSSDVEKVWILEDCGFS